MRRTIGLVALAAAALAGCASHEHHMQRMGDRLHSAPLLTVRQGVISVAPEPIVLKLKEQQGPIVWRAPAGFTFPVKDGKERKDGIEILGLVVDSQGRPVPPGPEALKESNLAVQGEASRAFKCAPVDKDRTGFACVVDPRLAKTGVYRYVIRVLDKDGKLIEWDPNIFGMD